MLDVVIVGGGPAGLAAALSLGRMRRRTLLIDSGEPRNASSPAMHNFLSRDGTPPAELRAIARQQLAPYPSVELRAGQVASAARGEGGGFDLTLADGESLRSRRILLASGVIDDLPDIPGLAALWGRQALHCPYCHGHEVSGQPLAVLGDNAHRIRFALHVTRLSPDVVLCTNGAELAEPELAEKLDRFGVRVRGEAIRAMEETAEGGIRILFEDGKPLERRAVFVQSRPRQRSTLAEALGCDLFDDGTVRVEETHETSVAGVYAAGDMARRGAMMGPAAAVIVAAAGGTVAAAIIDQDLVAEDIGMPLPWK